KTTPLVKGVKNDYDGELEYAFSRDGRLIAQASGANWIGLSDARTGALLSSFETKKWASCVAFSHDNRMLAAGSGFWDPYAGFYGQSRQGSLQVWEVASRRALFSIEDFPLNVWSVAFSPNGQLLAAAVGDFKSIVGNVGGVKVWDTTHWRLI